MKSVYIAVVGLNNYFGAKIFKPGHVLRLIKDYENDHDEEAIMAVLGPIGKVGYVANSTHTVPLGCYSAGRLYDTFETVTYALVKFVTKEVVIAEVLENVNFEIHIKKETPISNEIKA
jgi:hypothetical protein